MNCDSPETPQWADQVLDSWVGSAHSGGVIARISRSKRFRDVALASLIVLVVVGMPAVAYRPSFATVATLAMVYAALRALWGNGLTDAAGKGVTLGAALLLAFSVATGALGLAPFPPLVPPSEQMTTMRPRIEQMPLDASLLDPLAAIVAGAAGGFVFGLYVAAFCLDDDLRAVLLMRPRTFMWSMRSYDPPPIGRYLLATTVWSIVSCLFVFASRSHSSTSLAVAMSVAQGVVVALVIFLGGTVFTRLSNLTRVALVELSKAWPFARAMGLPVLGISIAYVVVVIEFASLYQIAFRLNPDDAFRSDALAGPPRVGDFLYFSLNTITTLGYSPLTPASPLVQFLTSVEVVAGIVLLTAGFAAVLRYLEQHFSTLARTSPERNDEDRENLRTAVSVLVTQLASERRAARWRHAELRAELETLRQQRRRPWRWGWWR